MARSPITLPSDYLENPSSGFLEITLSSIIYRLELIWNNRVNGGQGAWYHSLSLSDGTPVLLGIKLVLTDDVWSKYHYKENMPTGALRLFREDGQGADPTRDDLGTDVQLEYVT